MSLGGSVAGDAILMGVELEFEGGHRTLLARPLFLFPEARLLGGLHGTLKL